MSQRNILIVEDEPNIRLMLRTALDNDNYAIFEAGDGAEALSLLRSVRLDLVLLDLNMPVMDGMHLLEAMRDNEDIPHPGVIIVTAHGALPSVVQAVRLGASDVLAKPVDPDDLRLSVAAVLGESGEKGAHS